MLTKLLLGIALFASVNSGEPKYTLSFPFKDHGGKVVGRVIRTGYDMNNDGFFDKVVHVIKYDSKIFGGDITDTCIDFHGDGKWDYIERVIKRENSESIYRDVNGDGIWDIELHSDLF
jgi:hypothetical protein